MKDFWPLLVLCLLYLAVFDYLHRDKNKRPKVLPLQTPAHRQARLPNSSPTNLHVTPWYGASYDRPNNVFSPLVPPTDKEKSGTSAWKVAVSTILHEFWGEEDHALQSTNKARERVNSLPGIDDIKMDDAPLHYNTFRSSTDWDCEKDSELERIVHTNGTRVRLFMFYHSNRTEHVARRFAFCKDWIFPHFLHKSPYMESQVYKELFKPNLDVLIKEVDYVITCTYRHALLSMRSIVTPLTNAHIKQLIADAQHNSSDVVPLETDPHLGVLFTLRHSHGMNAIRAWNYLLFAMGFNEEDLDSCNHVYGFWRSSYVIRPRVLAALTELMIHGMHIVDTDEKIMSLFKRDAKYGAGDPVVAYSVFGTPYYQMHPFIFERLPAFFLTALNASVPGLVMKSYRRPAFKNLTSMLDANSLQHLVALQRLPDPSLTSSS